MRFCRERNSVPCLESVHMFLFTTCKPNNSEVRMIRYSMSVYVLAVYEIKHLYMLRKRRVNNA